MEFEGEYLNGKRWVGKGYNYDFKGKLVSITKYSNGEEEFF